jgi:NTP pyrophosphatase (non-canonical NTP hydrolase)
MIDLDSLQDKIAETCEKNNWDKDWIKGGCYIHLEVSEFIESLRGKGDDTPAKEAADVLFTLLAVMANYNVSASEALEELKKMV